MDIEKRYRELVVACERMIVGITLESTPACEWYEGIEFDGIAEARSIIAKS